MESRGNCLVRTKIQRESEGHVLTVAISYTNYADISFLSTTITDRWATDSKNGVLIAGYAVEHTLAKEIMNQPKEVVTLEGKRQPLNCLVDYVSFSAHVDFVQNRGFITQVDPKHIILVHGQKDEMGRLKSALLLQYRKLPEVSMKMMGSIDAMIEEQRI